MVDNIDEFIHVGRRRWDVVGYDMDPIYDIESHFQVLPLQLSQEVTLDQWQQGDEIFTYLVFLMIFSLTLRVLMSTPLSTWILSMKMIINHRCAQVLIGVRTFFA
jgi:hypothetical protein